MWIASKLGFYSVVQKMPGEFHVRARVRADLERLRDLVMPDTGLEIFETTDSDYRFRFIVEDPAGVMLALADSIDYHNFKSQIASDPSQAPKLSAYHSLWHDLLALQLRDTRPVCEGSRSPARSRA